MPGYAAFRNLCSASFPQNCILLHAPPTHGSYGTCAFNSTIQHSCGCSFACDAGYGIVGGQPYCEKGYLSSTAHCGISGCTDSLANNYDPAAEHDNGSCTYNACTVSVDMSPTNGGNLGTCGPPGRNMSHGEVCQLSCESASEPGQCEALPGAFRSCAGSCVPRDACALSLIHI